MIFAIEDDDNIRELVLYTLQQSGYEALGFSSAPTFWNQMAHSTPELILLDLMLPGQSGLEILKQLKSTPETLGCPVIILSAKGSEYDKVVGLDQGADDYITKPFSMMELLARIKAVLRRHEPTSLTPSCLVCEDLVLDLKKHRVTVGDEEVVLTLKEYELLRKLLEHPGVVLTREQLLEEIWGYDYYGETRTVDVHIRTLRVKLKEAARFIETIRGVGYRLMEP